MTTTTPSAGGTSDRTPKCFGSIRRRGCSARDGQPDAARPLVKYVYRFGNKMADGRWTFPVVLSKFECKFLPLSMRQTLKIHTIITCAMINILTLSHGNGRSKDLLGGKGAGLAEMSLIGLNVPAAGFVDFACTPSSSSEIHRLDTSSLPLIKTRGLRSKFVRAFTTRRDSRLAQKSARCTATLSLGKKVRGLDHASQKMLHDSRKLV